MHVGECFRAGDTVTALVPLTLIAATAMSMGSHETASQAYRLKHAMELEAVTQVEVDQRLAVLAFEIRLMFFRDREEAANLPSNPSGRLG